MSENLLEITNLVTEFSTENGQVRAVDGVNLTLKKGQTLGIVGESGSGKSVTSLSVMGLIPKPPGKISNGEILYYGDQGSVDLTKLSDKEMRNIRGNEIAMIFQEPMTSLNPVYSCGDQVTEAILLHNKDIGGKTIGSRVVNYTLKPLLNSFLIPLANTIIVLVNTIKALLVGIVLFTIKFVKFLISPLLSKETRKKSVQIKTPDIPSIGKYLTAREKAAKTRAIELFKKVKLPRPNKIFDSYPHQISGGQKQRVMIAMALSCNPKILIADEPTTALDVTVQKTILEILRNLQSEFGMGIIFITHDLGVIAELAHEIAVMYKGKIVEQGSVTDVFTKTKHPYTKGLLACRPPLDIELEKLPTRKYFVYENEEGKLVQTGKEVYQVIKELEESTQARDMRRDILYGQEPLLEVIELEKFYATDKGVFGKPKEVVRAVDNVSFKVYPGETLGLVGESGCGKTTLGRTILKLIEANSGRIIFDGQNILELNTTEIRKLRRDVQIIFQDPYSSLNPRMTVGEAIMEPMRVHKIGGSESNRKMEVLKLLDRVGLKAEHFNRYPHEFSGGQRQRICIARTIALKPKFVVCDESVSALDVSVQADVLNLLNELRDEFGLTYLFISHDLSVVKFMSDRIIVMNNGKIEESGLSEEIYNNPKTLYTQTLIKSIPKGLIGNLN